MPLLLPPWSQGLLGDTSPETRHRSNVYCELPEEVLVKLITVFVLRVNIEFELGSCDLIIYE